MRRISIKLILLAGAGLGAASAYYPGSPDRNLSILQTAEITENKHLFTRFNHRFEDPVSPEGENNPFFHLLGMDGPANIYMDASVGLANLWEFSLARERNFKTYGLETKVQVWNQRSDGRPLSLSFTANAQYRTDRGLESEKRPSFGGSIILDRQFFADRVNLIANVLAQTAANPGETGESAAGLALGGGLIYRYDRLSFFFEYIYPLEAGGFGYVREYDRAPRGIAPKAFGFNYRIWSHSFALVLSNYTDMLAANYIAGAHAPGIKRLNEWRIGFNLTRTFKLAH